VAAQLSNRFGILATHALVWTVPFGLYGPFEQPSLSQKFYLQVATAAIALFYFAACAMTGSLRVPLNGVLAAAVVFGVFSTVSSFAARSFLFTIKETPYLWCGILLLGILAHLHLSQRQVRRLLTSYVLVATVCAMIGVLQYLGISFRWAGLGYPQDAMAGRYLVLSVMGHPNYLTAFIGPALLLCPGLILAASHRPRQQMMLGVAACIIFLCIVISGTRSAWLATLLLGGAMAVIIARQRGLIQLARPLKVAVLAVVVAVALFVIPNGVIPHRYSFLQRLRESRPVEGRLYIYAVATRMITDRPWLGVGYNNFGVEFWDYVVKLQGEPRYKVCNYILEDMGGVRAEQAHNEYLEIAAETGVFGLASFLLMLVVFFGHVMSNWKAGQQGYDRLLFLGVATAVAYLLMDSLFNFPLQQPCSTLAFWFLLGIGSRYEWPEPVFVSVAGRAEAPGQVTTAVMADEKRKKRPKDAKRV